MVTSRETPTPANTATNRIGEGEYADNVAAHVKALWDSSVLVLTGVSGVDDIVAVASPAVTETGAGMGFWLTPVSDNTGPMTLDVGAGPMDLVHQNGDPIDEAEVTAGTTYLVLDTGSEYRMQNLPPSAGEDTGNTDIQSFSSSDVWNKPPVGSLVLIRCWAGGGSGGKGVNNSSAGGGGGGGAYAQRLMFMSELGSTVSVTIGAGGAIQTTGNSNGNPGGNSSFGAFVQAFGGAGGDNNDTGGGGGGLIGAGNVNGTGGLPVSSDFGGAAGGVGSAAGSTGGYGGGGGGGGASGGAGGASIYGGGGGGGGGLLAGAAGGTSLYGGNGGAGSTAAAAATAGSIPGGGGGGTEAGDSGAGADGLVEVIVW